MSVLEFMMTFRGVVNQGHWPCGPLPLSAMSQSWSLDVPMVKYKIPGGLKHYISRVENRTVTLGHTLVTMPAQNIYYLFEV